MHYLDTSVLVATLFNEAASPRVRAWLGAQAAASLAISDWTLTEMSSALALRVRTAQITVAQRAAALARFNRLVAENLIVLPVTGGQFRTAARFVDQQRLGLRAGDALHLAVAAEHGALVQTLDRRLADAGPALGVPVELTAAAP